MKDKSVQELINEVRDYPEQNTIVEANLYCSRCNDWVEHHYHTHVPARRSRRFSILVKLYEHKTCKVCGYDRTTTFEAGSPIGTTEDHN